MRCSASLIVATRQSKIFGRVLTLTVGRPFLFTNDFVKSSPAHPGSSGTSACKPEGRQMTLTIAKRLERVLKSYDEDNPRRRTPRQGADEGGRAPTWNRSYLPASAWRWTPS